MTKQEISFYDKEQTDALLDEKANTADLKTVAFTGDYDDLIDKPVIPAAQVQSDYAQTNADAVDFIKNKPALATVATSGDYDDLIDKPDLSLYECTVTQANFNIQIAPGESQNDYYFPIEVELGYAYFISLSKFSVGTDSVVYNMQGKNQSFNTAGAKYLLFRVYAYSFNTTNISAGHLVYIYRYKTNDPNNAYCIMKAEACGANNVSKFQIKPSAAGTAGQVLGLDSNLDPVWLNQATGNVTITDNTTYYTLNVS